MEFMKEMRSELDLFVQTIEWKDKLLQQCAGKDSGNSGEKKKNYGTH